MARLLIAYAPATTKPPPDQALKPGALRLALRNIAHRQGPSTRQLRAAHVLGLAESIAPLGLLEPLILDTHGYVLAGAHRLAALQLLSIINGVERQYHFLAACGHTEDKEDDPKDELARLADRVHKLNHDDLYRRYPEGKFPVHVIEIPEDETESLPLAIETAENSVRRQYTEDEARDLIKRLQEAGYTYRSGRPRKGEKTVVAALEDILGKSESQVRRILRPKITTPTITWRKALASCAKAAYRIEKLDDGTQMNAEAKAFRTIIKAIKATPMGARIWAANQRPKT